MSPTANRPPLTAVRAVQALWQGVGLSFRDPHLRARIIVAVLVNAILFGLLVTVILMGAFGAVDSLLAIDTSSFQGFAILPDVVNQWVVGIVPAVIKAIGGLLKVVVVVGTLMVSPLLFRLLAVSILPVYQGGVFLAARSSAGGGEAPNPQPALLTIIWIEVRRFTVFGVLSMMLLLLNLLPVIGTIVYGITQGLLAAQTLGWDLLSHHFEIHGMSLKEQRQWVRAHRTVVLAFGGAALLLCMIPVLQIFFITTNVAGAGVLSAWIDDTPEEQGDTPEEQGDTPEEQGDTPEEQGGGQSAGSAEAPSESAAEG